MARRRSAGATGLGGGGSRCGWPPTFPSSSSRTALIPLPPMSMASVRGSLMAPLPPLKREDATIAQRSVLYHRRMRADTSSFSAAEEPHKIMIWMRFRAASFEVICSRQEHSGLAMRSSSILRLAQLIALVTALCAGSTARAIEPPNPQELVRVELVAETASVASAATLWGDVHFAIKPGWHIYWANPGDSGLPTAIEWNLPPGLSAGSILWPVPERFVQGGIGNYGYAGSADLLVPITAAKDLVPGAAAGLAGEASWLVCADICIPGRAQPALSPPAGAGPVAADPAATALLAKIRRLLPGAAP